MAFNAFDIGEFGFFKDPDLTMRLSSDNLYDQMDPDGWIDLWFGGAGKYIPDIGDFRAHVICDTTFFWDIVDESGNRTKEGLERLIVSRNENVVPWYGDLVPPNPQEVFPYTNRNPAPDDVPLRCSNIWFYDNLLRGQYYRYSLVLLPDGVEYPNESRAIVKPMIEGVTIPKGYYIAAYRPKPEYRYQLAVMPVIKSGKEYSIHFRIKLDVGYLFSNPRAERYLKMFSCSSDSPSYLLYPEDPGDIVWDRHNDPFIPEYKRYLLVRGIQQRLPTKSEIRSFVEKRANYLYYSNLVLMLDSMNFSYLVSEISKKYKDESYEPQTYAAFIWPFYREWLEYRTGERRPADVHGILNYVLMKEIPWKGFEKLYRAQFGIVIQPPQWDTDPSHFRKKPVEIVEIDGVKQFSDGYVPRTAKEYLDPPPGYVYAGAVGNGIYKIMLTDGREADLYCDMDNGGWMLVFDTMVMGEDYVASIAKDPLPSSIKVDERYGVGIGSPGERVVIELPVEFTEAKFRITSLMNGCGKHELTLYGDRTFLAKAWSDGCTASLIVGQDPVYSDRSDTISDTYSVSGQGMNAVLTIAAEGDASMDNVMKYVSNIFLR